jgi:hypothetical protein
MTRAPVLTHDEYLEWRNKRNHTETKELIAETGIAPIRILNDKAFLWLCPGCGGAYIGNLGTEAVSGWDSPCWVRTGDDEHVTLTPSLGCSGWRDGVCPGGHYWLRDGELVPA